MYMCMHVLIVLIQISIKVALRVPRGDAASDSSCLSIRSGFGKRRAENWMLETGRQPLATLVVSSVQPACEHTRRLNNIGERAFQPMIADGILMNRMDAVRCNSCDVAPA